MQTNQKTTARKFTWLTLYKYFVFAIVLITMVKTSAAQETLIIDGEAPVKHEKGRVFSTQVTVNFKDRVFALAPGGCGSVIRISYRENHFYELPVVSKVL